MTPSEETGRVEGIDISKWDRSFDPTWTGTPPQFVIQRASYGVVKDPLFDPMQIGVQKVPIRGAYHYFSTAASYKLQADWFLSIVQGKGFHFYACDFEALYNEPGLSMVAGAVEWMRYVRAASGLPVILYSNIDMYNTWLCKDSRVTEFPFWIAWPPNPIPNPQIDNPRLPTARNNWHFWQYSFGEHNTFGKDNGVGRTGCDVDVFNGTMADLSKWLNINVATQPIPTTELSDHELLMALKREALARGWSLHGA